MLLGKCAYYLVRYWDSVRFTLCAIGMCAKEMWAIGNYLKFDVRYRVVGYRTVRYRAVDYRTVRYRAVGYRTVRYRAVSYRTVRYRAVGYCTVR